MSGIQDYLGQKLLVEWDASQLALPNATPITTWAASAGESIVLTGNGTYYASPDGDGQPAVRITTFQRMQCTPLASITHWLFVYKFFSGTNLFYRKGPTSTTFALTNNTTSASFNHSTAGSLRSISENTAIRQAVCGVTDFENQRSGIVGLRNAFINESNIGDVRTGEFVIGGSEIGQSLADVQVHHVIGCSTLSQIEIQQSMALLREQWNIAGAASIAGGISGFSGVRGLSRRLGT